MYCPDDDDKAIEFAATAAYLRRTGVEVPSHSVTTHTMTRLLVLLSLLAVLLTTSFALPLDSWPTCDLCHDDEECGHGQDTPVVGRIVLPSISNSPAGGTWVYHLNNEIPLTTWTAKSGAGCTLYVRRMPSSDLRDPSSGSLIPNSARPFFWFYFETPEAFTSFALDFKNVSPDPQGTFRCKKFIPSCDLGALQGITTYFM